MIPAGGRWALSSLALLLFLAFHLKGRLPAPDGGGAAFFPAPPGSVTVRLAGDLPRPGLYRLPGGTAPESAINMTLPGVELPPPLRASARPPLASGDLVTLTGRGGKIHGFSVGKMPARERMLLGIALHPDLLDQAEWDLLPGIGPVLAQRIVADRQKNGGFGSLEGLLRVPGLGPGRLAQIRRYF